MPDESFKEKIRSLYWRAPGRIPETKNTVDHTDDTVNTVTEHLDDRVDVHIKQIRPVGWKGPVETDG